MLGLLRLSNDDGDDDSSDEEDVYVKKINIFNYVISWEVQSVYFSEKSDSFDNL